jgi:hypothetical protein
MARFQRLQQLDVRKEYVMRTYCIGKTWETNEVKGNRIEGARRKDGK